MRFDMFCLVILALLTVGCQIVSKRQHWTSLRPPQVTNEPTTEPDVYRIGMGDVLLVTSIPSGETSKLTVGTDGMIRPEGSPPIVVDGLTTREVESRLSLVEPSTVSVLEYRSQVIHLAGVFGGEGPRVVSYQGSETVEQLMSRVGCKECQSGYRVRIVRSAAEVGADPEILSMEFDQRKRNRDVLSQSPRVQPGDFVYVEKNVGYKGPLTLLTDKGFLSSPLTLMKKVRLAKASSEIDRLK